MTPIKNISNLDPALKRLDKEQSPRRVNEKKSDPPDTSKSAGSNVIKDKVEISSLGRQKSIEQSEIARHTLQYETGNKLDDATAQAIRQKISNGFYSRPEVIDKIAGMLADLPGISQSGDAEDVGTGDTGMQKLAEIKDKIDAGVYDSDDVLNEIVDRLFNELNSNK